MGAKSRNTEKRTGVRHAVLVIIDGLPLDFIVPEVNSAMPFLSRLAGRGYLGTITSTIPPETGPAMASILTGANPGVHGIFSMYVPEVDPHSKQITLKASFYGKIRCPTIADISNVSRIGLGLFSIPLLWPVPRLSDGFAVPGFASPENALAYPSWAEALVSKKSGILRLDPTYFTLDPEEQAEKLSQNIMQKAELLLRLLEEMREPPAILITWISETDFAGHRFFDEPRLYTRVLAAADRFISRLEESFDFGRDSLLLVTGDHGMTKTSLNLYPNVPLIKAGYLRLKRHPMTLLRRLTSIPLDWLHNRSRKAAMAAARLSVSKESLSYKLLSRLVLSLRDLDAQRSLVFSIGGFNPYTPIYSIAEDKDLRSSRELREELSRKLREVFADTGLQEIIDPGEVYSGSMIPEGPLAILRHERGTANWTKIPSNMKPTSPPGATPRGVHELVTPLLAAGPSVKPERRLDIPVGSVVDLMPTILFALGKPIFDYMDGRPLLSIFEEELSRMPVQVRSSTKLVLAKRLRSRLRTPS